MFFSALVQFRMSTAVQLEERCTNTEPGVVATGSRCEMLNFDLKVVDSINQLLCTIRS
jgi:hypothetical protein